MQQLLSSKQVSTRVSLSISQIRKACSKQPVPETNKDICGQKWLA